VTKSKKKTDKLGISTKSVIKHGNQFLRKIKLTWNCGKPVSLAMELGKGNSPIRRFTTGRFANMALHRTAPHNVSGRFTDGVLRKV